jgi:hypothetical protein
MKYFFRSLVAYEAVDCNFINIVGMMDDKVMEVDIKSELVVMVES